MKDELLMIMYISCHIVYHQEEKEKKREEQLAKKKELQQMAEEEMAAIKTVKPKTQEKVTRAQIEAQQERQRQEARAGTLKFPHLKRLI